MFRIFLLMAALCLLPHGASAQSVNDLNAQLQVALKQGHADEALNVANSLYKLSDAKNDHKSAGFAAFAKASVLEQKQDYLGAAKAYSDCSQHYDELKSAAQSIQCEYKSGLTFLAGYKEGQGIDALKSASKRLESIGQEKSALAAQVYLTLAEKVLPAKLDHSRSASGKRRDAAEYGQKSLTALEAMGQAESESYASALFLKGLALEDDEKFEEAVQTYEQAVKLYAAMPNKSDEVLSNVKSRLSIAKFGAEGGSKSDSNTIDVVDANGREITMKIKKKKRVKFPRINKNQMVDGARVKAEITLNDEGGVSRIKILESTPNKEFGEALEKAIKKWIFTPPEGVPAEDIPPFEYSMVFYVKRL